MTPTVKMNFKNDPTFKRQLWVCDATEKDTQLHVMSCTAYEDLRSHLDLDNENDLVIYFSLVIKRRVESA